MTRRMNILTVQVMKEFNVSVEKLTGKNVHLELLKADKEEMKRVLENIKTVRETEKIAAKTKTSPLIQKLPKIDSKSPSSKSLKNANFPQKTRNSSEYSRSKTTNFQQISPVKSKKKLTRNRLERAKTSRKIEDVNFSSHLTPKMGQNRTFSLVEMPRWVRNSTFSMEIRRNCPLYPTSSKSGLNFKGEILG